MLRSAIGSLRNLTILGVNCNPISSRGLGRPDRAAGQLQALHWLNLAGNEFKALPDEINNLVLDLDRNSFEHVPKSLSDMTSLQVMSMKFNDITSLENDLILGFTGMTKLELRENPLRHKPHHWKGLNFILLGKVNKAEADISDS
ncbi:hypothetical protein J4Q44_G00354750 [Coregonus suidteri]|uniref:Uncharacterized protein n=1 Tax=Coregonus suidteri TaxID=861788 RepID=A0AAN8KSS9_9TELE